MIKQQKQIQRKKNNEVARAYRVPTGKNLCRNLLWEKSQKCAFCNARLCNQHPDAQNYATLDHLIPKSLGGCDGLPNLALSCSRCNKTKADRTVLQFLEFFGIKKTNKLISLHSKSVKFQRRIAHISKAFAKSGKASPKIMHLIEENWMPRTA
jgi:5-methylcytosine-specific restriction endonuclease McrA